MTVAGRLGGAAGRQHRYDMMTGLDRRSMP